MPLQPARLRPWMMSLFRLFPALLLIQVVVATTPSKALAQANDNVVAVVNADPITRKALAGQAVKRYGRNAAEEWSLQSGSVPIARHANGEVRRVEAIGID